MIGTCRVSHNSSSYPRNSAPDIEILRTIQSDITIQLTLAHSLSLRQVTSIGTCFDHIIFAQRYDHCITYPESSTSMLSGLLRLILLKVNAGRVCNHPFRLLKP